ncbi:uncharacterized protein LOC134183428 isoform X2 [Corticium candelabrum]|uniref:uncharacterized protein LOC134183428 isoform X2 n=1 Tax=Corticium candelabrum TaxID=121492 RepID=UPI002E259329|nr:uncharacterized protein LOC134183428 isoform X2 [Corticium candelabrum]
MGTETMKSHLTSSNTRFQNSTVEVEKYEANETSSCRQPLVSSSSKDYECAPPCTTAEWLLREETVSGILSTIYLCLAVTCTSLFVVVFTWAKVKKLRQFPHVITLLTTVFYLGTTVAYSSAFILGRRTAYCSHKDVFTTWEDPTKFCIVQGAFFHFNFIAALIMFSTSVFNVLMVIYGLRKPAILRCSSKKVMAVEVCFALGVAGVIVSAVLCTSSYSNDNLQMTCVPKTSNARFYSFTVPSQVVGVIGFIMAILIIKRMKQSFRFQSRHGVISKRVDIAGVVITRRFLVLVTVAPLVFVLGFSMLEIHDYFWSDDAVKDITNYILCQQTSNSSDCRSSIDEVSLAAAPCTVSVCHATFAVLLMWYSLFPGPARELWTGYFRKLFCCKIKQRSDSQTLTQEKCNESRFSTVKDNWTMKISIENDHKLEQLLDQTSSSINVEKPSNCGVGDKERVDCTTEGGGRSSCPKCADDDDHQECHHIENDENHRITEVLTKDLGNIEATYNKKTEKDEVRQKQRREVSANRLYRVTNPEFLWETDESNDGRKKSSVVDQILI